MKHKCFLLPLSFQFYSICIKVLPLKIMYTCKDLILMVLRFQILGINKVLLTVTAHKMREFWIRYPVAEHMASFSYKKNKKNGASFFFSHFPEKERNAGTFSPLRWLFQLQGVPLTLETTFIQRWILVWERLPAIKLTHSNVLFTVC